MLLLFIVIILLLMGISLGAAFYQSKSILNADVLNNNKLIDDLVKQGFYNFDFYVEKITTFMNHQPQIQMIKITGNRMITINPGTYDYNDSHFGQIIIKCFDNKKRMKIVNKYEYNTENINKIQELIMRINQITNDLLL